MRKLIGGLVAGTFVLSACQGTPSSAVGPRAPGATPKASGEPSGAPAKVSPAPATAAQALARLEKPARASTRLRGTVTLDAGYLVGRGGGKALTVGGQRVVGAACGR